MRKDSLYLVFGAMSQSVELINCSDLVDCFPMIFPGWQINEVSAENSSTVIRLRRESKRYVLEGNWLENPVYRTNKDAVICLLVAEVMRAFVHEDRELLCLHGAAVEFAGKLVLFPSNYRAGKSILSACLAATGVQLFSDDVLPVSLFDAAGIAPGLAPRLRLPLPRNLKSMTRDFIKKRSRLQGQQYLYLDLEKGELASRGSRLSIEAFVLLEREEGVIPNLEPVSEVDVLRQVIWQNFAREAEAPRILDVLSELVASSERIRLRYDSADDAARLLCEHFSDWSSRARREYHNQVQSDGENTAINHLAPGCYLRKPDINIVRVDDQLFLADGRGATIHHLNPIGSAIWSILAKPMTMGEMTNLLVEAFPDQEPRCIESDLANLIKVFLNKDLLLAG